MAAIAVYFYDIIMRSINPIHIYVTDINECETLPDLCANGRCINTLGSYRCSCNKAFKVDHTGTHCNGKQKPVVVLARLTTVWLAIIFRAHVLFGLRFWPTCKS